MWSPLVVVVVVWDFLDLQINPFTVLNCIQTYTEFTKNCSRHFFFFFEEVEAIKKTKLQFLNFFFSFLDKTTIERSKD